MSKKPTPKQKTSKKRTSERHAAWRARQRKQLVERYPVTECPKCKSPRLNHTACPECGYYGDRQVIDKTKKSTPTTKIKA